MSDYKLQYLPIFNNDLLQAVTYIADTLKNPTAAYELADEIEQAVLRRKENPLAFEPYLSLKSRGSMYYRIYVKNYVIYYVVSDDVMVVCRLLHSTRNRDSFV